MAVDATWYRWLRDLEAAARASGIDISAALSEIARKLGSPDGSIDGIPEQAGQSFVGLDPISVNGQNISLNTLTATTAGELQGLVRDAFGRVSGVRPVVAGAGITIDGTTDPDQIEISAAGLTNPMTTLGDLITGDTGGTPKRLAVGSAGQVLTVVSGEPSWAAAPGGLSNPMTTAEDLIKGGSGGTPVRLGVGSNGQVLTVTSGVVGWASPGGLTNPMTTDGDIITGGSSGTPQRLAAGANGQVLTIVSGSPVWAAGGEFVSGAQSVMELRAPDNSTAWSTLGYSGVPLAVGSAGSVQTSTTNAGTAVPRVSYFVSTPSPTAVAGARMLNGTCFIGSGTAGGFRFAAGWMVAQGAPTASHRVFVGLQNANVNQTDVNPSTLVSILGFGYDAGDTTVQFFHNDGSGVATKVNTGITKPTTNNSAAFRIRISCSAGGSVGYYIKELVSGTEFSGTATTDLPGATTLLRYNSYISAGGTSSTVEIHLFGHAITIP
jgi:hypothetical protein